MASMSGHSGEFVAITSAFYMYNLRDCHMQHKPNVSQLFFSYVFLSFLTGKISQPVCCNYLKHLNVFLNHTHKSLALLFRHFLNHGRICLFLEVVTGIKFSVDCKNLISVGGDG